MALQYGLYAESQQTDANVPHILSFATARTAAGDTLLEVWNGATNAARAWVLGLNGEQWSADGSAAAPVYSFLSDPDSGFYRIGANNVGLALNGAKVVDYAATGVTFTGTVKSSGAATLSGATLARAEFTATVDVEISGLDSLDGNQWKYAALEIAVAGGTTAAASPFVSKYLVRLQGLNTWAVGASTLLGGTALTIATASGDADSVTVTVTAASSTVCSIAILVHGSSSSPIVAFS
jgi:hypothetical protein